MLLLDWLTGRTVIAVDRDSGGAEFQLSHGGRLRVECLWRLVVGGRIVCTSEDHGQRFGHEGAVESAREAASILAGREISHCEFHPETNDLVLSFGTGLRLECVSDSAGYEAWMLTDPAGAQTIAVGGGGLAQA